MTNLQRLISGFFPAEHFVVDHTFRDGRQLLRLRFVVRPEPVLKRVSVKFIKRSFAAEKYRRKNHWRQSWFNARTGLNNQKGL